MGATDRKTNSNETRLHSLESQKHQYKDASEVMKAIVIVYIQTQTTRVWE